MKETATAPNYTAEELESLFRSGMLERIGMGSRRACYRIPGRKFCAKCYRSDDEIKEGKYNGGRTLSSSVVREICKARFDEKRNTSCQEYRYWKKLREKLPPEIFAVFPQMVECVSVPSRGWCLIEERVENFDGSAPEDFRSAYLAADENLRKRLLSAFSRLIEQFCAYAVRFYDPQNLLVQKLSDRDFALRIVDFEPSTRTFLPVDSMLPSFVRMKTLRRAKRWLKMQLGALNVKIDADKVLPRKLRAKWDALIASEGAAMGLSDCRVSLENKLVNDIFYKGFYKGEPCIVKCSSRAPDSIRNEYEMTKRLYSVNPRIFPKPLAHYCTSNGRFAFMVIEKLGKLSGNNIPESSVQDILDMAVVLRDAGVVHRDIFVDNLMLGLDGHLKLIDFQFAIDRNDYREDPWIKKNWKYRYVGMGVNSEMPIGVWNDVTAFLNLCGEISRMIEGTEAWKQLKDMEDNVAFSPYVSMLDRCRLKWYLLLLRIEKYFAGSECRMTVLQRRINRLQLKRRSV